jgi:hypothetical protein
VQAPPTSVSMPTPPPTPTPGALNDDSLGVICERTGGEPLELKPEGQGKFRLEYQDDAKALVSVDVRCNPITSSRIADLKFECSDRADPARQVLKITTETRQFEDEVGIPHPYVAHLHDIVRADGRVVHSEGDCVAYKFAKDGTRERRRHGLELSCEGSIGGECKVTTELAFELESFPVIDDETEGTLLFTASARASVHIHDREGKTVLAEQRFAVPELVATAAMDFSHVPGGETRLAAEGGDYRAQSTPAITAPAGGTFHAFDFIHFNDNETSFYFQPRADSASLKRCELVGPGDLRHHVDDLKCTKKLTPK